MSKPPKPDSDLTPFALMLRRWGYRQYPPIVTVPQLADAIGVGRGTVEGFFSRDLLPKKTAVIYEIVRSTREAGDPLPADELFQAAGMVVPPFPTDPWEFQLFFEKDPVKRESIEKMRRDWMTQMRHLKKSESTPGVGTGS